jgi:hypothetical protein
VARGPRPRRSGQHPCPATAAAAARFHRPADRTAARRRRPASLLTVPAGLLTLAALAGCTSSPAAPPAPSAAAPQATAGPPLDTASTPAAGPALAAPGEACARFAAAAAAIVTPGGTLGQARQAAARAYGTPRLQALYAGTGQGRDPQHKLWHQHRAHVLAHADPVGPDLHHDHDESAGVNHQAPAVAGAARVVVIVTGTAHGRDGWTAPLAPYRLECLLLADPVRLWLVDDLVTDPLPKPATTLAPTASH